MDNLIGERHRLVIGEGNRFVALSEASKGGPQILARDGGITSWTGRLLDDRREQICISASGLDRIALGGRA